MKKILTENQDQPRHDNLPFLIHLKSRLEKEDFFSQLQFNSKAQRNVFQQEGGDGEGGKGAKKRLESRGEEKE